MVVHYDSGDFFIGDFSGRHTITSCGLFLQDSYKRNLKRITVAPKKVTCKNCLKKINKQIDKPK